MTLNFAQFTAKPSKQQNLGGWFTVRRPGKDDPEIKQAKKKAELERKIQRLKGKAALTKKGTVVESDDDDFIVDSDDDDDDDDDAQNRPSTTSTYSSSSDDDSAGMLDDSKYIGKLKTSQPMFDVLKAKRRAASIAAKKKCSNKIIVKKTKQVLEIDDDAKVDSESDDEEDNELSLSDASSEIKYQKRKKKVSQKKPRLVDLLSLEDDDIEPPARAPPKKKRAAGSKDQKISPYANIRASTKTMGRLSSEEDEHPFQEPTKIKASSKNFESVLAVKKTPKSRCFASDDDETPAKKRKAATSRSIQYDSEEESPHDMPEDENEQLALALALSESTKAKTSRKINHEKSDEVDDMFEKMEEDSEDHDEGDDQEAFTDKKEAKEASSVLSVANQLSAQVLQTMKEWSGDASKGMIVDGALALHEIDSERTPHSWISQGEIRTLLPHVQLADYQLIGVNWLALLHGMKVTLQGSKKKTNVNGVLADVMGLGKTVQTIAFLAWLRKSNRVKEGLPATGEFDDTDDDQSVDVKHLSSHRPHLIVVPSSVLSNWQNEFAKFCPEMKVVKYHGSLKERTEIKQSLRNHLSGGPNQKDQIDIILTTFSYFSSEKDDDRTFLKKFEIDYLIVDEAHCLKNPNGARYQNLYKFKTSHRLLLTGTPVQNSPEELMSLLCFLMPLFAEGAQVEFGDENESRAHAGQKMLRHFVEMEGGDVKDDSAAYRKLKHLFAPFVLRRRKEDVLSQILPPKTRRLESVPFDEATRKIYDGILEQHFKGQRKGHIDSLVQQHIFTQLRKAANHPLLLRTRNKSKEAINHLTTRFFEYGYFGRDNSCTVKHVQQELEKMSDFDIHLAVLELMDENPCRIAEMKRYTLEEIDLFSSPKFERLRVLLPELISKGHRILIFSQWTKCMDLLGCLMESLNLTFFRLDGQTQISGRQNLIDKFNKDPSIPVFLLSTRAGGMGINLTAADVCILHDLDFNPFNDLQAEDRCHRIGQKKCVTVIKMITTGTVDADIYEMQQRKAKMNAAILQDGGEIEFSKVEEKEMVGKLLNTALDRFLTSPAAENKASFFDSQESLLISHI